MVEQIYLFYKTLVLQVKVKHKHPAVRDRINAVNSKLKDSNGNRHIFVSILANLL